jgi:hypothetical protein
MGLPKTVRFEDELEKEIEEYLEINNLKFSQLLHSAIRKFISETQTITLVPANTGKFLKTAKRAFKKHKNAMDKLK